MMTYTILYQADGYPQTDKCRQRKKHKLLIAISLLTVDEIDLFFYKDGMRSAYQKMKMTVENQWLKICMIICMFFAIFLSASYTNSYGAKHYIDNAASGNNNGTSWKHAWVSFADINWNHISAGDTVYISGGSVSKSYHEKLTIGKSFRGRQLHITAGVDPNHNGTVIIDGEGLRQYGVHSYEKNNWKISKLKLLNHVSEDPDINCSGSINVAHSDNITIENCIIKNDRTRGIYFHSSNNVLIKGNYIYTGDSAYNYQTDGIYIQFGKNNIIDGNTVIIDQDNETMHMDPIQSWTETNLTVRNNWCELVDGSNNNASQGTIIQKTYGWVKVYNNVVLGSTYMPWQAMLIDQDGDRQAGVIYAWNNTVIAQRPQGIACRIGNALSSQIGEIKNNICISEDDTPIYIDAGVDIPSKVNYNCLFRKTAGYIGYTGGYSKTWDQWQGAGFDVNGINQDPGLDSGYRPDATTDPVVNTAITIGQFNTDKDGRSRPQGSAWDIGAFEFGD